jgi:hypothetical protein
MVDRVNALASLPALSFRSDSAPDARVPVPLLNLSIDEPAGGEDMNDMEWLRDVVTFVTNPGNGVGDRLTSLRSEVIALRDSDYEVTEADWSADYLRSLGMHDVARSPHVPRFVSKSVMQFCVTGDASVYDLFSAEGQLVRCLLAADCHLVRCCALRLWLVVASHLCGGPLELDRLLKRELHSQNMNMEMAACSGDVDIFASFYRVSLAAAEYISFWKGVVGMVWEVRNAGWPEVCFSASMCAVHPCGCPDDAPSLITCGREDCAAPQERPRRAFSSFHTGRVGKSRVLGK